eukprot:CFRG3572T1
MTTKSTTSSGTDTQLQDERQLSNTTQSQHGHASQEATGRVDNDTTAASSRTASAVADVVGSRRYPTEFKIWHEQLNRTRGEDVDDGNIAQYVNLRWNTLKTQSGFKTAKAFIYNLLMEHDKPAYVKQNFPIYPLYTAAIKNIMANPEFRQTKRAKVSAGSTTSAELPRVHQTDIKNTSAMYGLTRDNAESEGHRIRKRGRPRKQAWPQHMANSIPFISDAPVNGEGGEAADRAPGEEEGRSSGFGARLSMSGAVGSIAAASNLPYSDNSLAETDNNRTSLSVNASGTHPSRNSVPLTELEGSRIIGTGTPDLAAAPPPYGVNGFRLIQPRPFVTGNVNEQQQIPTHQSRANGTDMERNNTTALVSLNTPTSNTRKSLAKVRKLKATSENSPAGSKRYPTEHKIWFDELRWTGEDATDDNLAAYINKRWATLKSKSGIKTAKAFIFNVMIEAEKPPYHRVNSHLYPKYKLALQLIGMDQENSQSTRKDIPNKLSMTNPSTAMVVHSKASTSSRATGVSETEPLWSKRYMTECKIWFDELKWAAADVTDEKVAYFINERWMALQNWAKLEPAMAFVRNILVENGKPPYIARNAHLYPVYTRALEKIRLQSERDTTGRPSKRPRLESEGADSLRGSKVTTLAEGQLVLYQQMIADSGNPSASIHMSNDDGQHVLRAPGSFLDMSPASINNGASNGLQSAISGTVRKANTTNKPQLEGSLRKAVDNILKQLEYKRATIPIRFTAQDVAEMYRNLYELYYTTDDAYAIRLAVLLVLCVNLSVRTERLLSLLSRDVLPTWNTESHRLEVHVTLNKQVLNDCSSATGKGQAVEPAVHMAKCICESEDAQVPSCPAHILHRYYKQIPEKDSERPFVRNVNEKSKKYTVLAMGKKQLYKVAGLCNEMLSKPYPATAVTCKSFVGVKTL